MGITIGIVAWVLVPVLALAARVVIVLIALRGTKPSERPAILRALAVLLPLTGHTVPRDNHRVEGGVRAPRSGGCPGPDQVS